MISRAIEGAYKKMHDRGWDTIYYLVDLHETVYCNNYDGLALNFYPDAITGLQYLTSLPETKIILWSSVYEEDKSSYIEALKEHNIKVDAFNNNPFEKNTKVGCFNEKPYFSVLIDDKAGFIPSDWLKIIDTVKKVR